MKIDWNDIISRQKGSHESSIAEDSMLRQGHTKLDHSS